MQRRNAADHVLLALTLKHEEEILTRLEAETARAIGKLFRKQGEDVLEAFRVMQVRFREEIVPPGIEYALKLVSPEMQNVIRNAASVTSKLGSRSTANNLGIDLSFKAVDQRTGEYLKQHAAERVTMINDTTRDRIQSIISEGFDKNQSYSQVARNISKEFEGMSVPMPQGHIKSRAELIAVTEIREAHEHSSMQTAKEIQDMGYDLEKFWQNRGDSKVSDGCLENTGADWIDLDDTFPSGDQMPPRFPGCRCRLVKRIKHGAGSKNAKWSVDTTGDGITIRRNR